LNKGAFKHTFAFVLKQMCTCLKEHMGVDYVFCALGMVCPGSAVGWNPQDRNRKSMQRVQNQAGNQLGTLGRRRIFWEGPIFFKLCPTHFPGGEKFSAPPVSTGLCKTLGELGLVCV